MEGQVGAQVAPPLLFHQPRPAQFHEAAASVPSPPASRKRDFPWQRQQQHQQQSQLRLMGSVMPNPNASWNPDMWDWDSLRFAAKPSADASDAARLGTQSASAIATEAEQRKRGEESSKDADDDGWNHLTLRLGGAASLASEEPALRPSKRVRSGSPGNGGGGGGGCGPYPMCQVDDCKAELSNAKDYHRRHKVCEEHSKTTKALVGKQMQRFCQQCSRFHPLSEFDEGKRSCRRRLAGHNRRRRKTQPECVPSRPLLPGNQEVAAERSMDVANLLSILARLEGKSAGKSDSIPPAPDKNGLIQILRSSLNNVNSTSRLPVHGGFDLNLSQDLQQDSFEPPQRVNENATVPSTMNLLNDLSTALTASTPDVVASLSRGSSESSGNDKSVKQSTERTADANLNGKSTRVFPLVGIGRSNCVSSPSEASDPPVREGRQSLLLQLFGNSDQDSPPKKYLSSESSNPMEERSPSSSPPVMRKLFPLHAAESLKPVTISSCEEDNRTVQTSTSCGYSVPPELVKEPERRVKIGAAQNIPYQTDYVTSSGSDHSPSSSSSDSQDRTGLIIFKLFGKDPSNFPVTLRAQILDWLSHSPSDIESYIRPGCVVLSVYLSMPLIAWNELESELLHRVTALVQCSESYFWREGRFLVRSSKQLASYKDGNIHICKSWRTWSAPELTSVSPVAVVSGQETSLVLKGRNLTVPGTRIHCTYMGRYISKEALFSVYPGTIYDNSSVESFDFPGGSPNVYGRCFIEVENGFKGNSFPVIIADATICQELRILEFELDEDIQAADVIQEDQVQDDARPRSRKDVLHFLNELGWLFQRTNTTSIPSLGFSNARFKYLLTFSVERDWCALVKNLLDLLAERSLRSEALSQESLEMLLEIHFLNRAVKRKCRRMVDLLLNYSVRNGNSDTKVYLFLPNSTGPGGVTPLHLAASLDDSLDMVDALTGDPQEIGLNCWNLVKDDNNQSPYMYASARNNHSYNRLVARKLADRKNGQVSVLVKDEEITTDESCVIADAGGQGARPLQARSCAQCALMETKQVVRSARTHRLLARPFIHSMHAIAAVCVCVCLFFRAAPDIGSVAPFMWENLDFGPS